MTALKAEIIRLARKEAKAAVAPLRKPSGVTRLTLANLKRRVGALEKETRRLCGLLAKLPAPQAEPEVAGPRNWISGKGVRSVRSKLGLSQEAFAKLVGVSPNAVYNWERKPGMLRLREATKAALMAVRELGTREAKTKLAALAATKAGRK